MSWIIVKKFPVETDLSAVTGYLRQHGVDHQIYEDAGEQVVAVRDPSAVEPVRQFLDNVLQEKIHIARHLNAQVSAPSSAMILLSLIKKTPITSLLIILSILGAVIVWLDQSYRYVHWLTFQNFTYRGFLPLSISLNAGEYWRLLTPAFLHFSFLHVLFNSLCLWDFGRRIELLIGKSWYFIFFISTGIFSNAAQYFWSGPGLFGGMSGVAYALIGFIMVSHKLSPHRLTAVAPGVIIFMLGWLVFCMTGVLNYFIGGGIANAAHIGGLMAGYIFALLTHPIIKTVRD